MTFTPKLEIDLSSDGAPGWVDISSDVLSDEQIRWEYGIRSPRIDDRVASTGQFGFVLDNKNRKFSPNSTDCLAGFEIGNRVRLSFYGTNGADSDYTLTPTTDVSYATTDFGGGLAHAFSSNKAGSMAYALYSTDAMASTNQLPYRDMSLSVWVKVSTDQAVTTDDVPAMVVNLLTLNSETGSDGSRLLGLSYIGANKMQLRLHTQSGATSSNSITTDDNTDLASWNNYIFSLSETDGAFTLYRNGKVLVTSTLVPLDTDAVTGQWIQVFGASSTIQGANLSSDGYGLIGSVAHLALYDRALTDEDAFAIYSVREFQEDLLYVLENGAPTHYWALASGKRNALHTASADVFNKFTGMIADIQPEADRAGNRICKISAADWIDKAARFRATSIPIQVEQPSGTVVETMLAYTNVPPADFDIGTGLNTFTYAANAAEDNKTLLGELGKLTKSEPGYSYISGGATSDGVIGEQFVFEDRAFRQQNLTSKLTLDDNGTSDAMVDLRLFRSIQQLYNRVKTTVHPTTVDANAVVIYSLSTTVTPELPGGVATVLSLAYTDSDGAFETIGAVDVVSPERNTDYTVETALSGGSQVDNDIRQTILNTKSSDCIAYWTLYDTGSIAIRDEKQSNSRGDGAGGGDGGSTDPGSNYSSGTSSSMCVKPVSRYEAFK